MQLADGVIVVYLQSITFSKTVVDEALGKEKQFKNFFANVEVYLRQPVWRISLPARSSACRWYYNIVLAVSATFFCLSI